MNIQVNQHYKRTLQALTLVGVYCLHLWFFQGVMVKPDNETSKKFKNFFSNKTSLPKRNSSPAVDYSQLHKHVNDSGGSSFIFTGGVINTYSILCYPEVVNTIFLKAFSHTHLPDDFFKLYRRFCVFLI